MLNQSPRSRNISPYLCTNHCHKVDFSLCASMYKKFSPWINPKSKLVLAWYKLWAEKGERRERRFVFCVLYKFLQANLRYRARRTHEAEHTSQREASLPHVMLVTFATSLTNSLVTAHRWVATWIMPWCQMCDSLSWKAKHGTATKTNLISISRV